MIDIETIGVAPAATILTIAAQAFDPLGEGIYPQHYYARITLESQEDRTIDQGTLDWWATQPTAAREEAFNEQDRVPLDQALDELVNSIENLVRETETYRWADLESICIQYLSDINTDMPLFFRTIIHKNGVQNDRNKPHTHKR